MSLFRINFQDFPSRLLDDFDPHRSLRRYSGLRSFSPRFDVRESETAYHLDGELPGIAQKDIEVEFSDPQTLVVKGHIEREYHTEPNTDANDATVASPDDDKTPTATHRFWASERRELGEFQRVFAFPTRVDQDAVKANLKNGILSIVVPKTTAAAATKKITVE